MLFNIQSLLEGFAGSLFVLVEGMRVNVQRGRGLGVTEETGHCSHVGTVRNQKACVAVTETVDVQLFRETILFEDELKRHVKVLGVIGS